MAWLTGWQYRKKITIEGSSAGSVTDYQIELMLRYGSGTDNGNEIFLNGHCRTDFADIRFTQDDGETLIPHWIEHRVDEEFAVVWIKIPSIPASPETVDIYLYYGNSSADDASNPEDVADVYEGFESGVPGIFTNKSYVSFYDDADHVHEGSNAGRVESVSYRSGKTWTDDILSPGNMCILAWLWINTLDSDYDTKARLCFSNANTIRACLGITVDNSEYVIATCSSGGPSEIDVSMPSDNVFYRLKMNIDWDDGSFQGKVYDEELNLIHEFSHDLCSWALDSEDLTIYMDKAASATFDSIAVMKYIDPEPSVTSIGEEEESGGGGGGGTYTETLSDNIDTGDSSTKRMVKLFIEAILSSDTMSRITRKMLEAAMSLGGRLLRSTSRIIRESLALGEVISRTATHLIHEIITLFDSSKKLVGKINVAVLGLIDSLYTGATMTLSLLENIIVSDVLHTTPRKILSMILHCSDQLLHHLHKILIQILNLSSTTVKHYASSLMEKISSYDTVSALKKILRVIHVGIIRLHGYKLFLRTLSPSLEELRLYLRKLVLKVRHVEDDTG